MPSVNTTQICRFMIGSSWNGSAARSAKFQKSHTKCRRKNWPLSAEVVVHPTRWIYCTKQARPSIRTSSLTTPPILNSQNLPELLQWLARPTQLLLLQARREERRQRRANRLKPRLLSRRRRREVKLGRSVHRIRTKRSTSSTPWQCLWLTRILVSFISRKNTTFLTVH